jgi:hypothetical protein
VLVLTELRCHRWSGLIHMAQKDDDISDVYPAFRERAGRQAFWVLSAAISAPSASAARCTWLTLTSTPANSCSKALLSSKLTSAAVLPVMRSAPG